MSHDFDKSAETWLERNDLRGYFDDMDEEAFAEATVDLGRILEHWYFEGMRRERAAVIAHLHALMSSAQPSDDLRDAAVHILQAAHLCGDAPVADTAEREKALALEVTYRRHENDMTMGKLLEAWNECAQMRRLGDATDELMSVLDRIDLDLHGEQASAFIDAKVAVTRALLQAGWTPGDSGSIPDQEES